MPETDTGPQPISRVKLTVKLINGSPYISGLLYWPGDSRIYYLYSHYGYPVKSPKLAIILTSLLYLFAPKTDKICNLNSINNSLYLLFLCLR